jgi:hypothetical protein
MNLDLTDEESAALARLLTKAIDGDRFPLSPRIQTLKAIRAKIVPEPVRAPLPPQKMYAPPSKGRYRRRGWNPSWRAWRDRATAIERTGNAGKADGGPEWHWSRRTSPRSSGLRAVALAYRRVMRALEEPAATRAEEARLAQKRQTEALAAATAEYRRLSPWATGDKLAISGEVNRMIAAAINVDPKWFWHGPDAWHGAETPVLDWRERLVCSRWGSWQVDMVVTGEYW